MNPTMLNAKGREFVIVNVLENEGPLNVRQLGAITGFDQTTLGLHLNDLERSGVVKRETVGKPGPKRPAFQWSIA